MSVLEIVQMSQRTHRGLFAACTIALLMSVGLGPAFLAAHFTFTDHVYCKLHERLEHRENPVVGGEQTLLGAGHETLAALPDLEEHAGGCLLLLGLENLDLSVDGNDGNPWASGNTGESHLRNLALPHRAIPSLTLAPKTSPPTA